MKLTNDERRQRLSSAPGRSVEGVVRVRGLDLRVRGRGVMFERQDPVAVIVADHGRESRHEMPREWRVPPAAMIAAPVTAFVLSRLFSAKRRK